MYENQPNNLINSPRLTNPGIGVLAFLVTACIAYGSLVPFNFSHQTQSDFYTELSWLLYPWRASFSRSDFIANILVYLPFGFIWSTFLFNSNKRFSKTNLVLFVLSSFIFVSMLELCQLFLTSRFCSAYDLFANVAGINIGAIIAVTSSYLLARVEFSKYLKKSPKLKFYLLGYSILLFCLSWRPFKLSFSSRDIYDGLSTFFSIPFQTYQKSDYSEAFTSMILEVVLFIPLGAMLMLMFRNRSLLLFVALPTVVTAVLIEIGQLFIVGRIPDLSDLILYCSGAAIGAYLVTIKKPFAIAPHNQDQLLQKG